MPTREKKGMQLWESFCEQTVRRDRYRIRLDVMPDVLAWLLMVWHRVAASVPDMPPEPTDEQIRYVAGCKAAASVRLETIQWVIEQLPDSFRPQEWMDACLYAGMMIGVRDDSGNPMTKIGKAFQTEKPTDGPIAG